MNRVQSFYGVLPCGLQLLAFSLSTQGPPHSPAVPISLRWAPGCPPPYPAPVTRDVCGVLVRLPRGSEGQGHITSPGLALFQPGNYNLEEASQHRETEALQRDQPPQWGVWEGSRLAAQLPTHPSTQPEPQPGQEHGEHPGGPCKLFVLTPTQPGASVAGAWYPRQEEPRRGGGRCGGNRQPGCLGQEGHEPARWGN